MADFVGETPGTTIALVGPTAVGKTTLSLSLAERFSCEIVGLDSMQVYRHMDIGTAKATLEERAIVAHHLIDVADPNEEYHVARYIEEANKAMAQIRDRGRIPLLVGGTGLYLRALRRGLCESPKVPEEVRMGLRKRLAREGRGVIFSELKRLDPESAGRIHENDTQRLLRAMEILEYTGRPWSAYLREHASRPCHTPGTLIIGITCDRSELYQRINLRVEKMAAQGLLAEVENLLQLGYDPKIKSMQAIGYRHMVNFISGKWDWEETLRNLSRDTRQYAKRQMTWFGGEPEINWFSVDELEAICTMVNNYLAG